LIPACALAAACSSFPELDASLDERTRNASTPEFLPIGQFDDVRAPVDIEDEADRVAALKSRADRLRGPVLTSGDRQRLSQP